MTVPCALVTDQAAYCSSYCLIPVVECGACVDRLLVVLDDLRDRMAAINASIPPVTVVILLNVTELRRIQNIILRHQVCIYS